MEIKLGKFEKDVKYNCDLATALEFVLCWGESSEDTIQLLRLNAAAIGVALDSFAILPRYRPEKDKIFVYGFKVLERLLEKKVSSQEIYQAGSIVLTEMLKHIPQRDKVEEKEDFFCSPEQEE